MNIRVHIDRLILDGLDLLPVQRTELQAALEAELARLLSAGGLSPALENGAALPVLRLGELSPLPAGELPASSAPGAPGAAAGLGRQIARAVYGGLGRE